MIEEITITSLSGRGTLFLKNREYFGYWLGPVDWGQVSGQHQTYNYLNQIGESIVSTTIGARPISITGWVVDGNGEIQERCDYLNSFISPVEDYELEYNGKKIQFRPDISVAYSREYIKNNEKVRRFLIQGTCPYPLFSDSADTKVVFDQIDKTFRFPANWGQFEPLVFAVTWKNYSATITNDGGFSAGVIVKIKFSGEVRNPKVWNMTTGKYIGVNCTFASGDQLEISTTPGSKHITLWKKDGSSADLIKYRDYQTTWIQLRPGENLIAVSCDDLDQRNGMEVALYYTPLYLEVE